MSEGGITIHFVRRGMICMTLQVPVLSRPQESPPVCDPGGVISRDDLRLLPWIRPFACGWCA
jgi:hypothetical protein